MFTDCLVDRHAQPLYRNSPEGVREFLLKNRPLPASFRVYVESEDKLVTVEEYLGKGEEKMDSVSPITEVGWKPKRYEPPVWTW